MDCKIGLFSLLFGLNIVLTQCQCKIGDCIPLGNCHKLIDRVRRSARRLVDFKILRERGCGFNRLEPLVCCTNDERISESSKTNNNTSNPTNPPNRPNGRDNSYLLPSDCGQHFSNRIIGGETTEPAEFPWMVILEFQTPHGLRLGCGGSLINNLYVLTAGHCVGGQKMPTGWNLRSVRLGEYNIATNPDCIPDGDDHLICAPAIISIPVEEKITHENYGKGRYDHNDIALLRLAREVKFSTHVKPICLPVNDHLERKFVISGWGTTENGAASNIKLKAVIPIVDMVLCKNSYTNRTKLREIINSQICAGGEKGKDACKGDSGGPLMQRINLPKKGARWFAAGIVSYGPSPCGLESWPGVYTNVYSFKPWIVSKLKP